MKASIYSATESEWKSRYGRFAAHIFRKEKTSGTRVCRYKKKVISDNLRNLTKHTALERRLRDAPKRLHANVWFPWHLDVTTDSVTRPKQLSHVCVVKQASSNSMRKKIENTLTIFFISELYLLAYSTEGNPTTEPRKGKLNVRPLWLKQVSLIDKLTA